MFTGNSLRNGIVLQYSLLASLIIVWLYLLTSGKKEMTTLRVITLNCWGVPVPGASKLRKERMEAIGDELGKGEYDIVLLQEVWDKADYKLLQDKMSSKYSHCHYFYSGMIGSGVCVFSKVPILETCLHRFALNGYPQKIQHGDWFGGKGLGLCKLDFNGFKINIYTTHIHAEYNRDNDEYFAHRVSQAFQTSQFIKLTSGDADFIILGGDLNFETQDLGFKVIVENAQLSDTWKLWSSKNEVKETGNTCDLPSNSFADPLCLKKLPMGKRIDYLLFKHNKDIKADIEKCCVTLGRIPGRDYNYSDHEAVAAVYNISHHKGTPSSTPDASIKYECLEETLPVIEKGIQNLKYDGYFYMILSVICVFILYISSAIQLPYGLNVLITFIRVGLTITVGFSIWTQFVLKKGEKHGLMNTQADIRNILRTKKSNLQ